MSTPDLSSASSEIILKIVVPSLNTQKTLKFNTDELVWDAKMSVIEKLATKTDDILNYGFLYKPDADENSARFLDEMRPLSEYRLANKVRSWFELT
jgi:hypothetical protein